MCNCWVLLNLQAVMNSLFSHFYYHSIDMLVPNSITKICSKCTFILVQVKQLTSNRKVYFCSFFFLMVECKNAFKIYTQWSREKISSVKKKNEIQQSNTVNILNVYKNSLRCSALYMIFSVSFIKKTKIATKTIFCGQFR